MRIFFKTHLEPNNSTKFRADLKTAPPINLEVIPGGLVFFILFYFCHVMMSK